jgi:nitroimidazol reductase NimA-like FMN-containing flavoprotein (pyridoxamine 5'-phosphate oxidase superfamily)
MIVEVMGTEECTAVLTSSRIGRLACVKDNQPYVVPITFVIEGTFLYSFSMIGRKVEWMRQNPKVCVQVDEFGKSREWRSVVVYGTFEELPDRIGRKKERDRAWSLLSKHANWWEPGGLKPIPAQSGNHSSHLFYRISVDRVTGRQAFDEQSAC